MAGATTAVTRVASAEAALDRALRRHPVHPGAAQIRRLLNAVSAEVLDVFASVHIDPRATAASAIAARFPDRLGHLLRGPSARLVPGLAARSLNGQFEQVAFDLDI